MYTFVGSFYHIECLYSEKRKTSLAIREIIRFSDKFQNFKLAPISIFRL